MAKIVEEVLTIKFSKLIKDTDNEVGAMFGKDAETALEQVAQELATEGTIVEIVKE